jgi:hypothetical protein
MDNEPTSTIDEYGTKRWHLRGRRHREDGPAVEYVDGGDKWWCLHGKVHRVDGPAIEYANGTKEWRLNGKFYDFDDWLEANYFISDEEKLMLKLTYG